MVLKKIPGNTRADIFYHHPQKSMRTWQKAQGMTGKNDPDEVRHEV